MNQVSRCQPLLGTYTDITIAGDLSDEALHAYCNDAFEAIYQIQELMSFHDESSELSKINSLEPHTPLSLHPSTFQVIATALQLSEQTNGIYDVTIGNTMVKKKLLPRHHEKTNHSGNWKDIKLNQKECSITLRKPVTIDLGGIAKGFAIDQAMQTFKKGNLHQATINAGGDIKILHHEGETVHIRVHSSSSIAEHDLIQQEMLAPAIATSSSTFAPEHEPSHIIDTLTDNCITDHRSISIFAPDCMMADALTKAAFLLPKETLDSLLKYYKASVLIIA